MGGIENSGVNSTVAGNFGGFSGTLKRWNVWKQCRTEVEEFSSLKKL